MVNIISVFKMLEISQPYFHCMTMYKPTVITTDRKHSGSLVQRELTYPSRHAVFSVTQSELPHTIKYDRSRWSINNKISALFNYICALSVARSQLLFGIQKTFVLDNN